MADTQVFITLSCEYILIIKKEKAFQVYINFLLHKHEQIKTSLFPFCGFIYLFILRQLNLFWTLNLLISQIRPYDLKLVILLLPHLNCCNDSHILPNSVSYNHLKRVFFFLIRRLKDLPYGDHEAVLHTVIRTDPTGHLGRMLSEQRGLTHLTSSTVFADMGPDFSFKFPWALLVFCFLWLHTRPPQLALIGMDINMWPLWITHRTTSQRWQEDNGHIFLTLVDEYP